MPPRFKKPKFKKRRGLGFKPSKPPSLYSRAGIKKIVPKSGAKRAASFIKKQAVKGRITGGFAVASAKNTGCGPVPEKTCRERYYAEFNHPIKGNWFTTPCGNDPQGRSVGQIAQEDFEEKCEDDPKFEQYACHFKSVEHLKKSKNVKKQMFVSYYQAALASLQEAENLCKNGSAADFLLPGSDQSGVGGPGKAKASRLGRRVAAGELKILRGISTLLAAVDNKFLRKEARAVEAKFSREAITVERRAIYAKAEQRVANSLFRSNNISSQGKRGAKLTSSYIKSATRATSEGLSKEIEAAAISGSSGIGKFYQGGAIASSLGRGGPTKKVAAVTRKGPTPANIESAIKRIGVGAELGRAAESSLIKAAGPLGGLVERIGVGKLVEKEANKAASKTVSKAAEKIAQNPALESAAVKYSKQIKQAKSLLEKTQGISNAISKIGDDVTKATGISKGALGFSVINAGISGFSGENILGIAKSAAVGYLALTNPVVGVLFDISLALDVVNHVAIPLIEKAAGVNLSPVSNVTGSAGSVLDTILF